MRHSSLRVVAIHNGELATAPAARVLSALAPLAIQVIEVQDQDAWPETPDIQELIRWRKSQYLLEARWSQHLGVHRKAGLPRAGTWAFCAQVSMSRRFRSRSWFSRNVEKAVTAKHIRAWQTGFDAGAPGENEELLVVESDAALGPNAVPVIQTLMNTPSDIPRYVNLAGGLSPANIGIDRILSRTSAIDERLREYDSPVTNTSCAYMINGSMADVLLAHLADKPMVRELGIDWLINSVFLDLDTGSTQCLHADPPVLTHGSLAGITRSWHPDR